MKRGGGRRVGSGGAVSVITRLRAVISLLALTLVAACGGGGGDSARPPLPADPTAAEQLAQRLEGLALEEFYDASYAALVYRSPESIIWNALTGVYPLDSTGLDDISDAYQRETFAMYQVVLDGLRGYDRGSLSPADQLSYDFYEWFLMDRVDRLAFIYHDFVATYNLFGIQSETERFFTDIHPLASLADAEDYVTRLDAVIGKFRQVVDHLTLQSGAGIVEPRLTLDVAIGRLGRVADSAAADVSYYTSFRDGLEQIAGLSSADRQRLLDAALAATTNSVIPAYRELRRKLEELRRSAPGSIGVWQFPRGAEFYSYVLRHHTTTDLSAAQVHQLGLDELQRIHAEMRLRFDALGYPQNESLQQLYARVASDGGIVPAEEVKSVYESIIRAAEQDVSAAFDIFPAASVVVAEDDFGGFYIGPSFDGTRPGAFYAGTKSSQPWFQMPSLTYHESVPGHHTQIAIAMEQAVGPTFRRSVRFTAFVEGWALYAERLAYELGWYDDDVYGDLGRLQFEALRAARLVMDTGIHDLGWSFEQAVRYNQDNVGASRGASEGAAARYSVAPGQATAYMIGMLRIVEARERAIDELGMLFDLKEFHRVVLTSGGLPLPLLDGVVDAYIEQTLQAP